MQGWLEYTKYRKQRHCQYNDAVDYYRKTLLNIGITEWIKVRSISYIYSAQNKGWKLVGHLFKGEHFT